nr:hypothetical protein [Kofleriaceae bacterium]
MKLLSLAVALVVAVLAPRVASADHPAYLHALSDLRYARYLLQKPTRADVKWDENAAIGEIDAAIREIKKASIDDGKPLEDHPAVDAGVAHRDRLKNAMNLLHASAEDIEKREDNGWAQGLRGRALGHIRNAEQAVRAAIEQRADDARPPEHPAYLHALSDLRYARFLLQKPTRADVKWDENAAIGEIDAAIREIKKASIDDGKPLEDHPAVDANVAHRDRLKNAMNLLHTSAADIEQREDNGWAQGLRGRALGHIRNAEQAVRAAIEQRAEDTRPPEHPAYLHALSDLRYARYLLQKPARADVKWDENAAIGEIDAAIREIKKASIDDGKPIEDHPAVDANLAHRDRLKNAMNLLHSSAADIEQREDNGWAQGLRGRALDHIRRAEQAVRAAVEDRHGY